MKGQAIITKDGLFYLSKQLKEFVESIKADVECEIEIIILNKPKHFLFKYLWGFLYESMAFFNGDKYGVTKDEIHEDMKNLFCMHEVKSFDEIPKRQRKKCSRYKYEKEIIDSSAGEAHSIVKFIYRDSTSAMTHEEMKLYIAKVENHFFNFMNGNMIEKNQNDANKYRTKGGM